MLLMGFISSYPLRTSDYQVEQELQQRESMRFMALFKRKVMLYTGGAARAAESQSPRLFHLYSGQPQTFTSCKGYYLGFPEEP